MGICSYDVAERSQGRPARSQRGHLSDAERMKKFILIVYLLHDLSCETDGELKAEGGG